VGRRGPEVDVQDEDRHDDGARDEDHGEEEILADERRGERRRWVDLGDKQQEDVERVEDRDAHRNLLAGVRRNVEDKKSDRTDGHARKYEVDGVEQSFSANRDVELDVRIGFVTARIKLMILLRLYGQQIPLGAFVIVIQIHA